MKGSKVTLIGVIAVGSMLLAWLSLTLLSGTSPTKTKAVTTDPYHCPSCGREYPRGARGECPFCRIEEGGETKKKYSSNPFTGDSLVTTVLISAFGILLGVHVFFLVRSRVVTGDTVFYHINCPKCKRKLKYRKECVNQPGRCPLCGRPMIFPKPADKATWWKRWLRIGQKEDTGMSEGRQTPIRVSAKRGQT